QFAQPYDPRVRGPYLPGTNGRPDPFGRQPGIPGIPGGYDPLRRSGMPGLPGDRQPGMPPTIQDILNGTRHGHPTVGRPFDPLADRGPRTPSRGPGGGIGVNTGIPGQTIDERRLPAIETFTPPPALLPERVQSPREYVKPFPKPESFSLSSVWSVWWVR